MVTGMEYILGIDQSTQGTKALLFDGAGELICRTDLPHRQIVSEKGWVEHDGEEIYQNTVQVVKNLVEKAGIDKRQIRGLGISNQRETAIAWDRTTGKPIYNAVVWQCARGARICERLAREGKAETVRLHTGLRLSPYFSAAKLGWIMENIPEAAALAAEKNLCCGTIDSWLVYHLTGRTEFKTDYSNASRTQLFNIETLQWDEEICGMFGVPKASLPQVTGSDACFGYTDFEGFLESPIPIHGVMGDSHGALFGQGCLKKGMIKTTYGTGSSVMMNIGEKPVLSGKVVTSLAWHMGGKATYVLEGNINYTGAVITWLKDSLHLIDSPGETEALAKAANPDDRTYLVPAFTGLGAPYWDSGAAAMFFGMTRLTGRAELVKAGLLSIAYQITDVVKAMEEESGIPIRELRVDGGPTRNRYLMQFQSDMTGIPVGVPSEEELSGIGAAYAAGIAMGIYEEEKLFGRMKRSFFAPAMEESVRKAQYEGWKQAVSKVLE